MIGPRLLGAGQPRHRGNLGIQEGVVRPASPVPVGPGGRSLLSVSIKKPPGVALTYPENLGSLTNGGLVL